MSDSEGRLLCQHIKANGIQCSSPVWGRRRYCYFHSEMRQRLRRRARTSKSGSGFPVLEDANSIQVALMQTIDDVVHNRIDRKQASLVLYGLQTASMNLRHTNFEPMSLWDDDDV